MTYDCFTFWNELDLLEIRFNVLDPYVDKFVLCESRQTFSGKEKPLYFLENIDRFKKWHHKIIHVIPSNIETTDPFVRAGYQKDLVKKPLESLAKDEDIIYFGDLDEIWKPQEVGDKVYNLRQLNYCYYLNNRSSEPWVGTVVGRWKTFKTNTVNHWRGTHTNELDNGGWHFTNMGGIEQILKKLESYDHCLEANIPWVRDGLEERMKNGSDYLGRDVDWKGQPFKMWLEEENLPPYILDNKLKYSHLWK